MSVERTWTSRAPRVAGVLLAQEALEDVEPLGPEALVEPQPFVGAGERSGVEAAPVGAAAHLPADQSGLLERLDVLGGRRERDRERLGELADRARAARELAQHPPPRGVAQRVKDGIEFGRLKINHVVEYSAAPLKVNH